MYLHTYTQKQDNALQSSTHAGKCGIGCVSEGMQTHNLTGAMLPWVFAFQPASPLQVHAWK